MMGNTLDAPVTTKETHVGESKSSADAGGGGGAAMPELLLHLRYGVSSVQGWRVSQEDAHVCDITLRCRAGGDLVNDDGDGDSVLVLPGHSLFAVFDGHGTSFASTYASQHFVGALCRQRDFLRYAKGVVVPPGKEMDSRGWGAGRKKKKAAAGGKKKKKGRRGGAGGAAAASDDDSSGGSSRRAMLESAVRGAFLDVDAEMLGELQLRRKKDTSSAGCTASNAAEGNNGEVNHPEEEDGDARASYFDDFDSGTTANVILVTPQYILCANLGDSRAVLCRAGTSIALSVDHRPDSEEEEMRIRNAGGQVLGGKIDGRLAVSRALGDFSFKDEAAVLAGSADGKGGRTSLPLGVESDANEGGAAVHIKPEEQMVSPVPDIFVLEREAEEDRFLIAACDGIWDVLKNDECVEIVKAIFDEGESNMGLVCEEVLDVCLKRGSRDNMTVITVQMPPQRIGKGGGVMKRRKKREAAKAEKLASRR